MYDSRKYHQEYYLANRDKIRARQKEWYSKNRNWARKRQREYNQTHKEESRIAHKKWRDAHKEKRNHQMRVREAIVRLKILKHYSPDLVCQRCGYSDARALTLHHINKDGKEQRDRFGSHERWWIVKSGFPPFFQVLCMNCQFIIDEKHSSVLTEALGLLK